MLRRLLIAFGLVEIVMPEPIIEICERIGLRNPRCDPAATAGADGCSARGTAHRLAARPRARGIHPGHRGTWTRRAGARARPATDHHTQPALRLRQYRRPRGTALDGARGAPVWRPLSDRHAALPEHGQGDDERRDARRIGPAVAPAPPPLEVTAESSIQRTTKRTLAIAPDLLEVIAPALLIDFGKRLAFETPDRGRVRPWTIPVARLEGLAFVRLLHRDDVYRQPSGRGSSSAAASWRCSRERPSNGVSERRTRTPTSSDSSHCKSLHT